MARRRVSEREAGRRPRRQREARRQPSSWSRRPADAESTCCYAVGVGFLVREIWTLRPTLAARNPGGIPAFSSEKKPTRRFSTGRDTCSPPLAPLGPVGAGFSWGYISGLLTPGDIPRVVSAPRDLDSTSSFDAARPSSPLLGRRPSVLASPPTPPLRPRVSSVAIAHAAAAPPSLQVSSLPPASPCIA